MPTAGEYNLTPGIDFTALFGGYASALTQSIELAQPGAVQGLVLYQDTTPTVTGTYSGGPTAWFEQNKRFLWIAPTTGIAYAYKAGVGWTNVATNIPANTVTTAMLQNNSVTVAKLWVPNNVADAGKALVLDAGGANWLIADAITGRADGSIPVAKLTPGADGDFIQTVAGITTWAAITSNQLNDLLHPTGQLGQLSTDALAMDQWLPLNVFRVDSTGEYAEAVEPTEIFQANSIDIVKLSAGTGNSDKYVRVNSAGTAVEFLPGPTVTTVTKSVSTALVIPAAGATVTFAHGLASAPTTYACDFVCVTPNNGFTVGQTLPYISVSIGSGTELPGYQLKADATNVVLTQQDNTLSSARVILNSTTGLNVNFVQAEWTARITTILIA